MAMPAMTNRRTRAAAAHLPTGLFSSDEESDEKSENMTEASMHQAMDNSRRRDEDSDAEPLFLSPRTTQTTIVIRETVF